MKTYQGLTVEKARRLWAYDPDTGVLTWRVNRGGQKVAGKVAGRKEVTRNGYSLMVITCNNKKLMQSIVIWGMQTGAWPEDGEVVSFKDRDATNLKWENLFCEKRSAIHGLNKRCSNNTSGVRGVYWHKLSGKWGAKIWADGKTCHLGLFKTLEEATLARHAAAKEYFGDFCAEATEDIDCKAVSEWLESRLYSNNKSGVRGVSWSKPRGKWEAHIWVDGKKCNLGYFKTIEEAAAARKAAEEKRNAGGFRSEARS